MSQSKYFEIPELCSLLALSPAELETATQAQRIVRRVISAKFNE